MGHTLNGSPIYGWKLAVPRSHPRRQAAIPNAFNAPPAFLWSLTSDVGDAVPGRGVLRGHLRATLGRDANKVGGPRRAPDEAALARAGAGGSAAGAGRSSVRILGLDLGLPGGRHTDHIPIESVPPDEALPAGGRPVRRRGKLDIAVAGSNRFGKGTDLRTEGHRQLVRE